MKISPRFYIAILALLSLLAFAGYSAYEDKVASLSPSSFSILTPSEVFAEETVAEEAEEEAEAEEDAEVEEDAEADEDEEVDEDEEADEDAEVDEDEEADEDAEADEDEEEDEGEEEETSPGKLAIIVLIAFAVLIIISIVIGRQSRKESVLKAEFAEEVREGRVSTRSRSVALVLCVFLGWMGAHRFYVDKTGSGVLMLFTFGGFGIIWFIDLVTLASGGFKDKKGYPLKNWF